LNSSGSALVYSTFLPAGDTPTSIRLDFGGNADLTVATSASSFNGRVVPSAMSTARVNAGGNQVADVATVSFSPQPNTSGFLAAIPDGMGDVLVTSGNNVTILRFADGAVLYSNQLPNGAAGADIAPDGSGGFIVLGSENGVTDGRTLTMLTRFSPATATLPAILGVANVAGDAVSAGLAPGEEVAIYGYALGPQTGLQGGFDSGMLPTDLDGTEVLFNGIPAPILYTAYNQVNAVVPFEVSGSDTVNVQLRVNGAASNITELPGLAAEPAILANLSSGGTSSGSAWALNQDGSINSEQNPAKEGSIVVIFVNGAGLLTPLPADGTLAPFGPRPVLPVSVQGSFTYYTLRNWTNCSVLYAGAAPGEIAGLLQVNFRLPHWGLPLGAIPIQVTVGDVVAYSNVWASK
jgi:uncharacterized protein (TIGR03437 family)